MRPSAAAHYLLPCIGSTKSYLKHNHTVRKECTKYVARINAGTGCTRARALTFRARKRPSRKRQPPAPAATATKKNHAPKDGAADARREAAGQVHGSEIRHTLGSTSAKVQGRRSHALQGPEWASRTARLHLNTRIAVHTHATVPLQPGPTGATHLLYPHDAPGPSPTLCRLTASAGLHRRLQQLARRRGGAWARRGKELVR